MDLPRPNFQALPSDPFSVLKPSPPTPQGQTQPRSDVEAFSRHLADIRRNDTAQERTPPDRRLNPRDTLSEKRRNDAIDTRRETETREQADARQTERKTGRAEDISKDKETNADPLKDTDDSSSDTPIIEAEAEQIGTLQTTDETLPSDDAAQQPGEPSPIVQTAPAGEPPVEPTETPADETAETNFDPKATPQDDQTSVAASSKGQEIAQLANVVAQNRTEGAHAAANPHRAIQSPLQVASGEPGGQAGETPNLKDIAAQAASTKPATLGEEDGQPLPGHTQGKSLGHEAAEKLAQRKQGHDKSAEHTSPVKSAPAAPTIAAPRPAATIQELAAFGLRAASDLTGLSLNGDPSNNTSGNLPAIAQNTVQNSNPLLARFGALPGQAQAAQVPVTSIAVHMARNLQNGINRFEIRIDPPELGRIDVKMELGKDGKVTAHMTVERLETLDLLQRDARLLERALQHAGLNADEDSLNFSLRDDGTHEQQAELANHSGERFGKTADQTETPQDDQLIHTTTLTLTGDGRVDIRV